MTVNCPRHGSVAERSSPARPWSSTRTGSRRRLAKRRERGRRPAGRGHRGQGGRTGPGPPAGAAARAHLLRGGRGRGGARHRTHPAVRPDPPRRGRLHDDRRTAGDPRRGTAAPGPGGGGVTSSAGAKGKRIELQAAAALSEISGWRVYRRLQEGRAEDHGDLDGVPDCTVQVKGYDDIVRA